MMIGYRQVLLLPLALLMLVASSSTTAGASTQATSPWKVVTAPATRTGWLGAVSSDSASDAWAVGGTANGMLIDHWNGKKWSVSLSSTDEDSLADVAAISPSNVWAVGVDPLLSSLVEHWNGTKWSKVAFTSRFADGTLTGISALSPSNIWAVDTHSDIYHYNGSAWSLVYPAPQTAYGQQEIVKVLALSSTNVWVSTTQSTANVTGPYYASAIHWNGSTATSYQLPSDAPLSASEGIGAADAKHVWIVGLYFEDTSQARKDAYAAMWNGSTWVAHLPPAYMTSHELDAVAAVSPTAVWTVGYRNWGGDVMQDEWTGSAWTQQWGGPNPGTGGNELGGAARIPGTSQVWAVGSTTLNGRVSRPLVERCCS